MSSQPQKIAIRFLTALLKHQAEAWLGKAAAGVPPEVVSTEELQERIDGWFLKEETAERLLKASSKADKYFVKHCGDHEWKQVHALGFESLPSLQTAVAEFPKAMDSKAVKQALYHAFTCDLPNLSAGQCNYGAELYTNALLQAVRSIDKHLLLILVQDLWNTVSKETNNALLIRLMLIGISARPLVTNSSSESSVEKNESARANALVALAPYLTDELQERAWSAAREFRYKNFYACAFEALAPGLSDELKVQALQAAREIKYEYDRACTLAAIAPHLNDQLKHQALQEASSAAVGIPGDDGYAYNYAVGQIVRAHVLATLPPDLSDEHKELALEAANKAAWGIENEYAHPNVVAAFALVSALAAITQHINNDLKECALTVARQIKNDATYARALAAIAPHFEGEFKELALREALSAARGTSSALARARALTALAPHLGGEFKEHALQEALSATREIKLTFAFGSEEGSLERVCALAALAPFLNAELKEQAMQEMLLAVRKIDTPHFRARALAVLAPHLNDELKEQALDLARRMSDVERVLALIEISPHLNDERKEVVQREALSLARALSDDDERSCALRLVAPHLNAELQEQALTALLEFENVSERRLALETLAPHLNNELKEQALAAACEINHGFSRAHALEALVPYLNDKLKEQALSAAREIRDEYDRAHALAALAPHLNDELKEQVLQEALYLPSSKKILKIWEGIQFRGLDKHLAGYFRFIASKDQSEGIQRLSELIPALVHFSGREIANEIFRAIGDTVGWRAA
jgi:hypothetical protein